MGVRESEAGKQVKRYSLVDTLGLIIRVVLTAANVQDRDGAKSSMEVLRHKFSRVRRIWADGAYAGLLVDWVKGLRPHRGSVWRLQSAPITSRALWSSGSAALSNGRWAGSIASGA